MVLDAGKLVEFDSPANLLEKKEGYLKALVDGSGDRDALYAMARGKAQWSCNPLLRNKQKLLFINDI